MKIKINKAKEGNTPESKTDSEKRLTHELQGKKGRPGL